MLEELVNTELLASIRTNDFSEPLDLYFKIAEELESTNRHNYITRANFIREQINGNSGEVLFNKCRDDWDVYSFPENILTVDDFKRGFLWRFRDHKTSWIANEKAKIWFLTSPEALFVRRYEFWICDNGFTQCIDVKEGSYKEILLSLLKDGDYEVLCSSVFSKGELDDFIKNYSAKDEDQELEVIIEEYISANPNYDIN